MSNSELIDCTRESEKWRIRGIEWERGRDRKKRDKEQQIVREEEGEKWEENS